ncbi:MAG: glycosyltransferase [Gammaproteobacteria bacterium]|nr:glycosyltransferase [Gammaproteobacteria bacterium]
MPIYNEEKFVHESLTSLINQDYENLEIIVSNNASTDHTESICKQLAKKNKKIKYYTHDINYGISDNFNFVLEKSSGKYFMWASGHDLWSPNYISECVKLMESNPNAVISFGSSKWIDHDNNPIQDKQYGWIDTRGLDNLSRYVVTFWGNMHPILGVINRDKLAARNAIGAVGTDMVILCRLALIGDFIHAINAHWERREFRNELNYDDKIIRYKSKEFGLISSKIGKLFPLARLPIELFKDIIESNLTLYKKIVLAILLLLMLPFRYIAGKRTNSQ